MGQLNRVFVMAESERLKNSVKTQMLNLESLVTYLEDRGVLGAKEYVYCQAKLQEILKHLKRLERMATANQPES